MIVLAEKHGGLIYPSQTLLPLQPRLVLYFIISVRAVRHGV
jgi:hypothetical protein